MLNLKLMNKLFSLSFFLPFLFFSTADFYSQSAEEKSLYLAFDQVTGPENSGLINGVAYVEQHRTINEKHKFFLSERFHSGYVEYNGQPYYDVDMKYNIHDQLLFVKVVHNLGETVLQLVKERLDAFHINGREFVNIKDPAGREAGVTGFYEVLLENSELRLLKRHSQQMSKRLGDRLVYYEFDHQKNDPVLNYDGNYYEISSRRDLFQVFPDRKKEIREYYRSNRSARKSNLDKFMTNLLRELTTVSENNAVQE